MDHNLPDETYRVFPEAYNFRNTYDSPTSVSRAIGQRLASRWGRAPNYTPDQVRVYRAETHWREVTGEFVPGANIDQAAESVTVPVSLLSDVLDYLGDRSAGSVHIWRQIEAAYPPFARNDDD